MKKTNKIKGGVYSGYWFDYYSKKEAKKFAHKQERMRIKKILRGI